MVGCEIGKDVFPAAVVVDGAAGVEGSVLEAMISLVTVVFQGLRQMYLVR